jgi:gas vesicle protein
MGKTADELRRDIEVRREDLTRDVDALGDRVSPQRIMERRTDAVRGRFRSAKEAVMGRAEDVSGRAVDLREGAGGMAGSVRSSAGDVAERAQEGMHRTADTVSEVPERLRHEAQGNPLAAGLVAFGLGLLAATTLPESRRERRLARQVQPALEDAARVAADSGRELAEDLKPRVAESAEHLRERARESVDHVSEQAAASAHAVADEGKGAASAVRETAKR